MNEAAAAANKVEKDHIKAQKVAMDLLIFAMSERVKKVIKIPAQTPRNRELETFI